MALAISPQLEARWTKILSAYPEGKKRSAVIPMLIFAQDETGAITPELIDEVAARTGTPRIQVDEVVGFYSMLHRQPQGKYHVQVCTNISCMLAGGAELWEHAKKTLHLDHKETSPDGLISLEEVECMGACSWAPAVEVNYDFHHRVTPQQFDQIILDLKKAHV
jgi:NADH-quinone oxidoreductase subunit E